MEGPSPFLSGSDGQIVSFDEEGALFRDDHHLTTHGALRLEPQFVQLLAEITSPSR